jgi:hypothetical protein
MWNAIRSEFGIVSINPTIVLPTNQNCQQTFDLLFLPQLMTAPRPQFDCRMDFCRQKISLDCDVKRPWKDVSYYFPMDRVDDDFVLCFQFRSDALRAQGSARQEAE